MTQIQLLQIWNKLRKRDLGKICITLGAVGLKCNKSINISGCFNCDGPSHVTKDCVEPMIIACMATSKLRYFFKKNSANFMHVMLAQLFY